MTTVKTTAKAKKHQVFVGTELKAESNSHSEILEAIQVLQKENVDEFKHVNHTAKSSNLYKKGRYDKNYTITGAEYEAPSKAVSEEGTTE